MTEGEAADLLAVSVRTLQGWRFRGGGPRFVRVGSGRGAIRYARTELDDYVAERVRRSTSDPGEVIE